MLKKYLIVLILSSIIITPQGFLFAQSNTPSANTIMPSNTSIGTDFFYSPLSGMEQSGGGGGSLGDAIKSMVKDTILNAVMDTLLGRANVPTSDASTKKSITSSITQTFTENFKQQLTLIKNDLKKMINESGDYILQKIFAMTLQRVTKSLSKLQIKNPELYSKLNTYGGLIAGMSMYSQRGCIDPAVMGCVKNAIQTTLLSKISDSDLNSKAAGNIRLSTARIIGNLTPCSESAVPADENAVEPWNTVGLKKNKGGLSFNNLFKKIPFFADVLKTGSKKQKTGSEKNLAQVGGTFESISDDYSIPTQPIGDFVSEGVKINLTNLMCQDAITGLITMASSEAAKRLEETETHKQAGFAPQRTCLNPFGADPNKGEICEDWGTTETPASTIEEIAGWASTAEGDSIIARMNDPHGVNVVSSWFKNWMYSKMDNILNKGFSKAADTTERQNIAMGEIGKQENINRACADIESIGGSGVGSELKKACVDAYKSQVKIGAQFDKAQITTNTKLATRVYVNLDVLTKKFKSIENPNTNNFSTQITKYESYLSNDITDVYKLLSKDYEDLNAKRDALFEKFNSISGGSDISEELNAINNASVTNATTTTLKTEIANLQVKMDKSQADFTKKISAATQLIAESQLNEIFFEPITSARISRWQEQLIDLPLKLQSINYNQINQLVATPSSGYTPAFKSTVNNTIYYLNQDVATDRQNLKESKMQSTIRMLSDIVYAEQIPDRKKIEDLEKYYNIQKQHYINLEKYVNSHKNNQISLTAKDPNQDWEAVILDLTSASGVVQKVSLRALLSQASSIFATTSILLTEINNSNILSSLSEIQSKESALAKELKRLQDIINEAYDVLVAKLSSTSTSNYLASESELSDINDEIESLDIEVDLIKSRIAEFKESLNEELDNIPKEENPPTEEPQSLSPQKSSAQQVKSKKFIQGITAIISAPYNLTKLLIGNIMNLINNKRVKLK